MAIANSFDAEPNTIFTSRQEALNVEDGRVNANWRSAVGQNYL
jgi:hypothetical protein